MGQGMKGGKRVEETLYIDVLMARNANFLFVHLFVCVYRFKV
jgi:hypothetical protein